MFLACAFFLSAWSAAAQTEERDLQTCIAPKSENLPADRRIAACTAFIAVGTLDFYNLPNAYRARALGYREKRLLDFALADYSMSLNRGRGSRGYTERADAWFEKGYYGHAKADLDEALRIEPDFDAAKKLHARVLALLNSGDRGTAPPPFEPLRQACSTPATSATADARIAACAAVLAWGSPDNLLLGRTLADRGRAYTVKGDVDLAVTDLLASARIVESARTYADLGAAIFVKKQYDRAMRMFETAIKIDPKSFHAWIERGSANFQLKRYDLALADLDVAIRLAPDNADGYVWRALTYMRIEKHDRAIADFTKALRIKPDDNVSLVFRASAYRETKQYARAVADHTTFIRLNPKGGLAYQNRCRARAAWGRELNEALADCNMSLQLRPSEAITYQSRALVQYRLGNYAAAVADASQALALDGEYNSARYVRGVAKLKSGDAAGGNADIAAAKAADPDVAAANLAYGIAP